MLSPAKACPVWLLAAGLAAVLVACGPKRSASGGPIEPAYALPDYLRNPPLLSGVPLGSRDVAAFPPAGVTRGPILLRFFSEPGAKIYFGFDAKSLTEEYTQALLLKLPVEVYAQAEVGDKLGPVRVFAYKEDRALWPDVGNLELTRLSLTESFASLRTELADKQRLNASNSATPTSVTVDGKDSEWPKTGLLYNEDGLFDVPQGFGTSDINWAEAYEAPEGLYVVMATRDPAKADANVSYGFDLGRSQITPSSFGPGSEFIYHVEVKNGDLKLTRKDLNKSIELSSQSRVALGDVVEIFLAASDIDKLDGQEELILRCFANDTSQSTSVVDRMEPMFLRTQFDMTRHSFVLSGRPVAINFRASHAMTATGLPDTYGALAEQLMPELEAANQIRIQAAGSLPFFYTVLENSGYSGLNTSDRGLLTTIGPNSSLISKAQLLAHELAHYQNARDSQLQGRWLQEGMSEWSAARLLTQHFPPRAVYKFLRSLRLTPYFEALQGKDSDDFPLDDWQDAIATLGYEKSFMFVSLLESRFGSEALRKVFQRAVNEKVDSEGFARLLTQETGDDVRALYPYWVTPGEAGSGLRPEELFGDDDGDELLNLDEQKLGADKNRPDSDGDGYLDSEELFRGTSPSKSDADAASFGNTEVALVNSEQAPTELLRFASKEGGRVFFSLDPFASSADDEYKTPLLYRPPYILAVQAETSSGRSAMQSVERKLYVNGSPVTQNFPDFEILPSIIRTTTSFASEAESGSLDLSSQALADHIGDLPAALSAYDIASTSADFGSNSLTLTIATKTPPDPFGAHGDYLLVFDVIDWSAGEPDATRMHALNIKQGAPYWHNYSGSSQTSKLLQEGVDLRYSQDIQVTLDKSLYSEWFEYAGEKLLCAYTEVDLPGGVTLRDRAACIASGGSSSGFTRRDGFITGSYGARHQLALSMAESIGSAAALDHYQKLGLSALKAFEDVAGRPLLDRSFWPVHLTYTAGLTTSGSATQAAGAYLSVPVGMLQSRKDYLFVEQLARLLMADLLDKTDADHAYWLQEAFIQWLTASAMYRIARTADVHAFHYARLLDLRDFLNFGSSSSFDADIPLQSWNAETINSDGSAKSLLLLLRLNTLVGAEGFAKSFGTFFNEIPNASQLKSMLKGYAAANAAAIDALWSELVEGSVNAAADKAASLDSLTDNDGDYLFKFEEEQLGTNPAVSDTPF